MSADPAPAPEKKPCAQTSMMYCPLSYSQREDFAKLMKECKEESFWYRALPFSLGGMLVTQGLVYKGYLTANKRFGSLPKVALAGVLGFILGKISYARTCQRKFENSGIQPMSEGGFLPPFGPQFGNHPHK
ncbi:hypothetical protein GDO86_000335 [Hymenochirus boettgeri]|nr:hypothetical protein GDO86_000335 [Hymenochirus boettgeri]